MVRRWVMRLPRPSEKFPQRDPWRLNQLNLAGSKAISMYGPIEVFTDVDFAYLHHANYRAVEAAPKYNLKIRAGLRYDSRPLIVEFYGNYYHHNLIGFEPITFNQRTEHRFDEPSPKATPQPHKLLIYIII